MRLYYDIYIPELAAQSFPEWYAHFTPVGGAQCHWSLQYGEKINNLNLLHKQDPYSDTTCLAVN